MATGGLLPQFGGLGWYHRTRIHHTQVTCDAVGHPPQTPHFGKEKHLAYGTLHWAGLKLSLTELQLDSESSQRLAFLAPKQMLSHQYWSGTFEVGWMRGSGTHNFLERVHCGSFSLFSLHVVVQTNWTYWTIGWMPVTPLLHLYSLSVHIDVYMHVCFYNKKRTHPPWSILHVWGWENGTIILNFTDHCWSSFTVTAATSIKTLPQGTLASYVLLGEFKLN